MAPSFADWRTYLNRDQLAMGLANHLLMMSPLLGALPLSIAARRVPRAFVGSTKALAADVERGRPARRPVLSPVIPMERVAT